MEVLLSPSPASYASVVNSQATRQPAGNLSPQPMEIETSTAVLAVSSIKPVAPVVNSLQPVDTDEWTLVGGLPEAPEAALSRLRHLSGTGLHVKHVTIVEFYFPLTPIMITKRKMGLKKKE